MLAIDPNNDRARHGLAGLEGDARHALSALARRVDLLVVGPPRHGPLVHLLRGDVLAHLARTSPCPVVLIDLAVSSSIMSRKTFSPSDGANSPPLSPAPLRISLRR